MINELKEKYFNLNDIKIYAKEIGEGPLVIMVHGWPESWYSWRHQLKPIADSVLVFFDQKFEDILRGNTQQSLFDY